MSKPLREILAFGLDDNNYCICTNLPIGNFQIFFIRKKVYCFYLSAPPVILQIDNEYLKFYIRESQKSNVMQQYTFTVTIN